MDTLSLTSVGGLVILATTTVSVAVASFIFCRKAPAKQQLPEETAEERPVAAASKKQPVKKTSHVASDKAHVHHHLCVNTIKGHQDAVTGIAFSLDGRGLATACGDRVVRVFKLEDCASKSFKFLRINLPLGSCPTAVAFGEGSSQLVIAAEDPTGAYVCLYGSGGKASGSDTAGGKLPPPEMKWEKKLAHNGKSIITLVSARSTHGGGDGGVLAASCSEGTDIKVWLVNDGKCVGHVDTNQLQNHMAALSPNGRFLAAAAFTADVKIWEVQYEKNGAVKEIVKCMQLKGHKSAVTWLSFSADSQRVVTASKDGTIKIWNINVRYHLQEDPKCLRTFDIPLPKQGKNPPHYDRIAISPDDRILATSVGADLQWLSAETGEVLDEAKNAHDGFITCLVWAPANLPSGDKEVTILATASNDKKLKLWASPA
eukprot:TRINITY_DN12271_c0_g1_i1.p1 TRINITY_DN12271_c0_g1~~TRINITY_DN12271_c0_g1_i1.p1  ORF type:complete len:429 (-),score=84.15 TRINITY_DN12271_c0_g1_i1:396-1682(-)